MTTSVAVGERVDVHFRGFLEELIDQHRPRRAHQRSLRDVFLHGVHVVGDDHGAAAQHVAGAHQHRQADLAGDASGFFGNERGAVARLRNSQFFEQAAEATAIFGEIDRFGSGADDGHAVALQFQREIERRLPAELHDDALRLFAFRRWRERLRA